MKKIWFTKKKDAQAACKKYNGLFGSYYHVWKKKEGRNKGKYVVCSEMYYLNLI